ncbi:alpha-ketoacid dehydrogenase subunit beta [Tumebacillus sp. ITR2]|uniref:Alpha-ketoacid dehydrogenase subunit beta n=1 Tax=Tumebacillus amylolyticus TaxID=2801339 RepID=A0ABS1JG64_9BACL|nr:alpha-ketoacid dehydrogenase subunit beta [Tumebacillus amylolyticus]MBL0389274.1 alpha-ketoacid dehydrogenase subunit beta [Tumebacillus amylolyticus]
MAKMTIIQAITEGLRVALREDERVLVLGEDVGVNGGVFRATEGLQGEFGPHRVVDTPLAEAGIIGSSVGLAVNGMRPIPEIQFFGFIYPAMEQIVAHVSRVRMRSQGRFTCPMVIRAPYGAGIRAPELHGDSPEAFFVHQPGIKVVCPSNPYDAKGLLLASIDDPDPVLFLEPLRMYRAFREEVPEGRYTVELGKANVVKPGKDVSVFAWGTMLRVALEAAKAAAEKGVDVEVVDLRTLSPLDRETIAESVKKTGRAVVVHEAPKTAGLGAEIAAVIQDEAFLYLEAPVVRVAGYDTPQPLFSLEDIFAPDAKRILHGIDKAMNF